MIKFNVESESDKMIRQKKWCENKAMQVLKSFRFLFSVYLPTTLQLCLFWRDFVNGWILFDSFSPLNNLFCFCSFSRHHRTETHLQQRNVFDKRSGRRISTILTKKEKTLGTKYECNKVLKCGDMVIWWFQRRNTR